MRCILWCFGIACVAILGIPIVSEAFEVRLTQEQIKEANEYGAKYKGKDVFESNIVKSACFGKYPGGDGGLIMSKYIRIAVVSAMSAIKDKTLTPEEIKDIEESTTFNVVVSVSNENVKTPEDVQIILKQGENNILPQKTEFGMKYKDNRQGVIGIFNYGRVNPDANTTIVVKTGKDQKKYTIDFSDVK